ncbi:hypothetical protein D3C80_1977320 [compost metagenome]
MEVVPKIIQCIADAVGVAHQIKQRTEDPDTLVQAELETEKRIVARLAGQFQHQGETVKGNQGVRVFQYIPGQAGFSQQLGRIDVLAAGEFVETMK